MWPVAFISIDNEPAADQPVRMVDAAGKAEPAGKRITALDRGGDALGVERGGHHCFRVLAPDIFLRLERKCAEHLGVIGHDRLHPALGAVGPGQALRDTAQRVPAHGLPAETFGLGHADQARFAKIGNRFRRHHAGLLLRLRHGRAGPGAGPPRGHIYPSLSVTCPVAAMRRLQPCSSSIFYFRKSNFPGSTRPTQRFSRVRPTW